jgi:hypothetical protein
MVPAKKSRKFLEMPKMRQLKNTFESSRMGLVAPAEAALPSKIWPRI